MHHLLKHLCVHYFSIYSGDWFCSEDCSGIWQALNGRVAAGSTLLDTPDYSLQLMRGRDTSGTAAAEATNDAIDTAQQVTHSFDHPHAVNAMSLSTFLLSFL